MKLESLIAWRYLRAKKKEGFISVITVFSLLGMILGVGTLIVVMAVMNGFRIELMTRVLGIDGHVVVTPYQQPFTEYDTLISSLGELDKTRSVAPLIEGQALASANNVSIGALVKAFHPEDIKRKSLIANNIILGSLDNLVGGDAVIIGKRMALSMGLRLGDEITLISPKTTATVIGSIPRIKSYKVVGLFDVGMYEYDSSTIFMPLSAAQLYFKMPGAISGLEVMAHELEMVEALVNDIRVATKGRFRITDWQTKNYSFINALRVERVAMFFILSLIILVAAFNIISGLIMLVHDKHQQIAILRTMGMGRGSVMTTFLLCGMAIGVLGTVLGVLLGVSFASNIDEIKQGLESLIGVSLFNPVIYFLSQLPAKLEMGNVITVSFMSLSLSFLATLYPAWKAAKLNPAEILRYE